MSPGNSTESGQSLYAAGRYAEALPLLIAAARTVPTDRVLWEKAVLSAGRTLGQVKVAELAREALRHHPRSDWMWRQLGRALTETDRLSEAAEALHQATRLDPDSPFLWRGIAELRRKQNDLDGEIDALNTLVSMGEADSNDLNQLGIAHHRHRDLAKALTCYRSAAAMDTIPGALYNMGLVFNDPEVSQDADAADAYRRVLLIDPSYQRAAEGLERTKRKLVRLAAAARPLSASLLQPDELFRFYINPFELFQLNPSDSGGDLDIKSVQRAKKRLLQEIELNDGCVDWLGNCRVDRSQALEAEDALHDETLREYHGAVFQNLHLLRFLTRGHIEHFLYSDGYFPDDTLALLEEDDAFLEFLSGPFARQYNSLLTRAVERGLLPVVEALFDGRRWVRPEDDDVCFEGAMKRVGAVVDIVKRKADEGASRKIPLPELLALLKQHGVPDLFNLLPTPFAAAQREIVTAIRSLAIDSFNEHGDAELSKGVLELCSRFSFRSIELTERLKEDRGAVERLIAEERRHESRVQFGDKRTVAITKEGLRDGAEFLPASSVLSLRWGLTITRGGRADVHDFLLAARGDNGKSITVNWRSQGADAPGQEELFSGMIKAALHYVGGAILVRLRERVLGGTTVSIGGCTLTREGVGFQTQGFIFKKDRLLRWADIVAEIRNGDVVVRSRSQPGVACAMPMRDVDNAVLLPFLTSLMTQQAD